MPDQKKPKVTIGPDGTIHVDNNDAPKKQIPESEQTANGTIHTADSNGRQKHAASTSKAKQPNQSAHNQKPSPAPQTTSSEKPGCVWVGCGFVLFAIAFIVLTGAIGAGIVAFLPIVPAPIAIIVGAFVAVAVLAVGLNKE